MKNYPIIAIVGTSGSGKSSSIENLDPLTTVILNIENKSLPFRGANKFIHNKEILESHQLESELDKALKDPTIKIIIVESFTSYCDKLVIRARRTEKGWDIWNYQNDKVSDFLEKLKNNNGKIIIVIAIDEVVKMMSGSGAETNQRRIQITGKKHEGKIEYHFPIVLFTQVINEKDKAAKYQFVTNSDGLITAKSPRDMFAQTIPNDLKFVVEEVKKYYELS